jgi:hypothetical protein
MLFAEFFSNFLSFSNGIVEPFLDAAKHLMP